MTSIVERLRGFADANEDLGLYTEAKCLREAAARIEQLEAALAHEAELWAALKEPVDAV